MARPGTINKTKAVEVNIQAVAPVSIMGASAANKLDVGRSVNAQSNNVQRSKIFIR